MEKIIHFDLKNDVVFKTIFGQNTPFSKKALKALLEAYLHVKIKSLEITTNEQKSGFIREKQIVGDVTCILDDGTRIQVEMQMYEGWDNLPKRLEYYESRLVASQELEGHWYDDLCPSYTIMFMNFNRIKDDKMIHHFVYRDEKALVLNEEPIGNIITVELPKCSKNMTSEEEQWSYYIRNCINEKEHDTIEMIKEANEVISMVDEKLKNGFTQSEKENIIKMMEDKARLEAEMYSVEGHIAHAKRKGIKQGKAEGREEERTQMILKMNKKLSSQEIANLLEIDIEEIEKVLNK